MQKATFKISAFLLCGLLIYNSLGYFWVLSVIRHAVQQKKWTEVSTTPHEQLTAFSINKNRPVAGFRIRNSREIEVDGRLYDIAKTVDNGSNTVYYCVRDSEEQNLIDKSRLYNSQAQQFPMKNTTILIIDHIIKYCIINQHHLSVEPNNFQYFSVIQAFSNIEPVISILHPPPQV